MQFDFEEASIEVCGAYHGCFSGKAEIDEDGHVTVIHLDQMRTWATGSTLNPLKQTEIEVCRHPDGSKDQWFALQLARFLESEHTLKIDELLYHANPRRGVAEREADRRYQMQLVGLA